MPSPLTRTQHPANKLSNELIALILDQVEPDADRTVPVDRRRFLSVESFDSPPPSSRGSIKDVGRFRLASKRFAELGAPLLFTRVAARLSKRGLQKLEQLAGWPHLCRHVRKFTYMVPFFYANGMILEWFLSLCSWNSQVAGNESSKELLARLETTFSKENIARFESKVREQHQILDAAEDLRVLKRAIAQFTALQHVQLLRVQDDEDIALLSHIRQHDDTRNLVRLEWASACSRGSQTIGAALLASKNVPWSRFSSPMLSPQSAEFLNWRRPSSLSILAERLTCLTLHFDDGIDLDEKMSELSGLFKAVFSAAKNMQVIHVGFPMHRPLALPLEAVFHNVTWERLVAFGVQGWKLDTESILDLALRHKERLKGLRLRGVFLKEGSLWKDVLKGLRESMHRLEWVSLRHIGYTKQLDAQMFGTGVEVLDDLESESESDVDDYDPVVGPSNGNTQSSEGSTIAQDSQDEDSSDSDDEHGPAAHDMDFPSLESPITPASAPWCNCNGTERPDSVQDLGDDGNSISNTKRKAWEKWVVRRCLLHDDV